MLTYAVKLASRYDGLVIATFPDVPAAIAYGRDHEEAIEQAEGALEAALIRYMRAGHELPIPRAQSPLTVTAKLVEQPVQLRH